MTWLNPMGWLWGLLALPVILLYVLRIRRRRVPVPTVMFWDEVFEESKPRAWWQRMRHWVSLLLQLLFLALLTMAVADPLTAGQSKDRRLWVLLIDHSASMSMPSGDGSRLDEAKERAGNVIGRLREWDEAMVLSYAGDVEVLCGRTANPGALRDAIDSVQATGLPGDSNRALAFANSLLVEERQRQLVFFTDEQGLVTNAISDSVHWDVVGGPVDNLGITGFSARPATESRDLYRILIKLQNGSDRDREVMASLRLDDVAFDSVFAALGPGEEHSAVVEHRFPQGGLVEAVLKTDSADGLKADDRAALVIPAPTPLRVGLVLPAANIFLQQVLAAQPLVEVRRLGVESASVATNVDLLIYHRIVPDPMPDVHAVFLQPEADSPAWTLQAPITNVLVSSSAEDSPLLEHIRLENLFIQRAVPMVPKQGEVLFSSFDSPLCIAWNQNGFKRVALGVDLERSDLPLRTAFPILMANVVNWVGERSEATVGADRTGDMQSLEVGEGSEVVVTVPEGGELELSASGGRVTLGPWEQAGVYTVAMGDTVRRIAVNLANSVESNGRPSEGGALTTIRPLPGLSASRPLWLYLALTAFLLCLVEWWLHQRRWVE